MKKIQLLTSIILTLLMIIAPQSIALAADDSSQASAVSLISDGFSIDKKAIYAGDTFKLKYKIKNTNSKLDVKNLNMRLSGGDTFTVANDVDTIYSPSLSKGTSAQFSKNFYVSAGASAGMYPITAQHMSIPRTEKQRAAQRNFHTPFRFYKAQLIVQAAAQVLWQVLA